MSLLIVDLGSQTTGLLGKAYALQNVPSRIIRWEDGAAKGEEQAASLIARFDAAVTELGSGLAGIVLSGSPASVNDEEGRGFMTAIRHIVAYRESAAKAASAPLMPMLGVCFGFQALSVLHGGAVAKGPGEYGAALVRPRVAEAVNMKDAYAAVLQRCLAGLVSTRTADVEELGEGAARTPAVVAQLRAERAGGAGGASGAGGAGAGGAGAGGAGAGAAAASGASSGDSSAKLPELHVWSSHGDDVVETGALHAVAAGQGTALAAAANADLRVMAVQWHPEHSQTCDAAGVEVLYAFANECGVSPRHITHEERSAALLETMVAKVKSDIEALDAERADASEQVKFMVALSGGVDSAVAAGLVAKALQVLGCPDRLHLCYVDTGLMRDEDAAHVAKLSTALGLPVVTIDAKDHFFGALAGVMDDNEVRMAVGRSFAEVLATERERHGSDTKMVQGTLASDVVESTRIKAHHNVGGLPKDMVRHVFEPLRTLFKSDVRRLAAALGLGNEFVKRRPFPGPGLALRVVGAEVNPEHVAICRAANAIWRRVLHEHNVPHAQSIAAVCPTITFVGVRGDERSRGCLCMLRAVLTRDFMTAWPADIPHDVLLQAQADIVKGVPAIGRVVYDVTSKPPACVEFR